MKPLLKNVHLSTLEFKNVFECLGEQFMCHIFCCKLATSGAIGEDIEQKS
jgi:hypothetical protein